ncbi:cyclic nucleotide-binding domain-containing protein [Roseospirillum parvum]|uniref:Cyclic nucleotide-binding domain-containing protein n=1 Tax=Roseospirillum parvum TaxID=83401 RepID=A0A1G7YCV7_9PROT|nr:cyclic nucleotide-binding domain-containing protein [Roseospirillum parvum]SDG94341.1 Cyclic nucleotide-binding domain-containing protein [Roseospirillum parvum]
MFRDPLLERRPFPEGATIFRQNDPGDAAYLVESGKVAIYKQVDSRKVHLGTLHKGSIFGEMAVVDGSPRMASAVALEASVLVRIPGRVVQDKLGRADPFIRALIDILMENLRNVHAVYMTRPRSIADFVKVLEGHSDSLRQCVNLVGMDELSNEMLRELGELDATVRRLTELSARHVARKLERRADVIPDPGALPE